MHSPTTKSHPPPGRHTLALASTRAEEAADGALLLKFIASSDAPDLAGTVMTKKCMDGMAKRAVGMTMFMNHIWEVPAWVFGVIEEAKVTKVAGKQDVEHKYQLEISVRVAASNPTALQTYDLAAKDGVTLGASIGGYIMDWDPIEDTHLYEVNEFYLLEISVVGIPCNQTCFLLPTETKAASAAAQSAPTAHRQPAMSDSQVPASTTAAAPTAAAAPSDAEVSRSLAEQLTTTQLALAVSERKNEALLKQLADSATTPAVAPDAALVTANADLTAKNAALETKLSDAEAQLKVAQQIAETAVLQLEAEGKQPLT